MPPSLGPDVLACPEIYIYIYIFLCAQSDWRENGWQMKDLEKKIRHSDCERFLSPYCMCTFSFSLLRVANPSLTTCTLAVFAVFAMCVMHQSLCSVNWCMTIPGYMIATLICSEPIQRC